MMFVTTAKTIDDLHPLLDSWREHASDTPISAVADPMRIEWLNDFVLRNKHRAFRDYRWDAVKFAYKTARVIEAAHEAIERGDKYLGWVDADVIVHSRMSAEQIESWVPADEQIISWLWRDHMHPECGFYILNLQHPAMPGLLTAWKSLYTTDAVYKLKEWHDSYVLAWLIDTLTCLQWRSLSGDAQSTSHPFINGPLGEFMDHMKGPGRKAEGKSFKSDIQRPRKAVYWSAS